MNVSLVFESGDPILIAVFLSLIAMSVVTWYLIVYRSWQFWRLRRQNQSTLQVLWSAPNWHEAESALNQPSPLARLALSTLKAIRHFHDNEHTTLGRACGIDEYLTRTIRKGLSHEIRQMETGMTILASIASTAPFIGLFGTVWGIYHTLTAIGMEGQASLGLIAGPMGEALIATAAGLAAAIPAALAYNAFLRQQRNLTQDMEEFAYDLHAQLLTHTEAIHRGIRTV